MSDDRFLSVEDSLVLIRRYAADELDAVVEERRRHAERRAELCP